MNFEEDVDQDIEKWETDTEKSIENSLPDGWLRDSWKRMNTFRWVINAGVVGIPFTVFMATAIGFNLFCNIVFNHWWAEGNVYLMF